MRLHPSCYISSELKKPQKLIHQLSSGKGLKAFYFVAISSDGMHLEIYHSFLFKQKRFQSMDLTVVAIYKGEEDCLEHIRRLTDVSLEKFHTIDYMNSIPFYTPESTKKEEN